MYDLSFRDRIVCRGCLIYALFELHIESIEPLVGFEGLPQLLFIDREFCCRYPGVVDLNMAEEGQRCGSGEARERVIKRGEVHVLKGLDELVAEGIINVTTLIILSMLLCVISDELLIVKGGCIRRDGGRLARVGHSNEGDLTYKPVLYRCQDDPKVAVLAPSVRNLNRHQICGEETIGVSDGSVVRFPRMLGEGWV